jgi:hypothetical protein
MRPALAELETLEAYISGTLPADREQDVEIKLLWDQDYKQSFVLQKLAYQALKAAGRAQLREELKAIHARLFTT